MLIVKVDTKRMNYIFATAVGLSLFTIISAGGNSFVDENNVTTNSQQLTTTSTDDEVFNAWKLKYNKSYATIELEKQAKTILLQMKAKADAHNLLYDQGLFSYTMGLWENSDISLKDITRLRRPNTVFTGSELFRTFREPATEEQLKSIIDKKGRIPAVIDTADNAFLSYKSGVYECQNTELNLQLNVLIIGYGTENNIDYWLCKNSWGTSFGESGKFKIVRKNSPCGLKVFLL